PYDGGFAMCIHVRAEAGWGVGLPGNHQLKLVAKLKRRLKPGAADFFPLVPKLHLGMPLSRQLYQSAFQNEIGERGITYCLR
ncbi:MAG: hypothetical protein WCO68_02300, partial [Verrucomicrobiota bacterium]